LDTAFSSVKLSLTPEPHYSTVGHRLSLWVFGEPPESTSLSALNKFHHAFIADAGCLIFGPAIE
jgi:hypothetical protein